MRKSVCVLVMLSLILLLCGCGGGSSANENNNADSSPLPELPEEGETENLIEEAEPSPLIPLSVNDEIIFGSYEQDNDKSNGPESIEWIVLEIEDDGLLLISKYCLDCRKYNEKQDLVTWETCTLREWMNSDFFDTAFTEKEKALIRNTHVDNSDPEGGHGSNDTNDNVYLLSYKEIQKYFGDQKNADCNATEYAAKKGVILDGKAVQYYWLRGVSERNITEDSKGNLVFTTKADLADSDWSGRVYGPVTAKGVGVRPVMWIQWDDSLAR